MKKLTLIVAVLLLLTVGTNSVMAETKTSKASAKQEIKKELIKAPQLARQDYTLNATATTIYSATWQPVEGAVQYKFYYGHDKDPDLETYADAQYKLEQNKDAIMARMKRNFDGSHRLATEELKAALGSYTIGDQYKRFAFFYATAVDKDGNESQPSNIIIYPETSSSGIGW